MSVRPVPQRLIVALLAAALVAFACGPRTRVSEARRSEGAVAGPPIAASLDVRSGDVIAFAFVLTNSSSRRIEVSFPSGQTHDVAVLDSVGREVWRWSDGRLFTQAMQNAVLRSAEALAYEAQWRPSPTARGQYVAVATLLSENHPIEQRTAFVIP